MALTLFYDGQCPLCLAEMRQLKTHDRFQQISFVDLNNKDFTLRYPHINKYDALHVLHAELDTGELLLGLDATHHAWSLVGKHRWLSMLRWPLIRTLADAGYKLFARYRYRISYWLTGQARCSECRL